MIFRLLPLLVAGVFLSAGLCPPAEGIVIDDFTVGPYSMTGSPSNVVQAGLDGQHVVGGERQFSFGNNGTNSNSLTIDTVSRDLTFATGATSRGYLELYYGGTTPLDSDFTAGGHDRFRIDLSQAIAHEPFNCFLSVTNTPSTSNLTVSLNETLTSLSGSFGIIEIPFQKSLNNVLRIQFYLGRLPTGGTFTIDSITTAGPPMQGDYNRDSAVDLADYTEWRRLFGKSVTGGVLLTADGNGNGVVDQADYVLWRRSVGQVATAGAVAVPEPTTTSISVIAAAIVGGAMRSRLFRR